MDTNAITPNTMAKSIALSIPSLLFLFIQPNTPSDHYSAEPRKHQRYADIYRLYCNRKMLPTHPDTYGCYHRRY
ncbi:MAG: hypothetical protein MSB01_01690 [Bacteroidales bacterium]|nr:hypothetical protein [Bacteroidales bacterium]